MGLELQCDTQRGLVTVKGTCTQCYHDIKQVYSSTLVCTVLAVVLLFAGIANSYSSLRAAPICYCLRIAAFAIETLRYKRILRHSVYYYKPAQLRTTLLCYVHPTHVTVVSAYD
jgi:hypothetical protein